MSIEKINAAREQIASTSAYKTLTAFFDEGSFTEIDAFVKSGDGFAEVTAGFGTVEGLPVYAFRRAKSSKSSIRWRSKQALRCSAFTAAWAAD